MFCSCIKVTDIKLKQLRSDSGAYVEIRGRWGGEVKENNRIEIKTINKFKKLCDDINKL